MDHDRFDHWTRRLAAGASRRAALTGAAASLLGALGWRRQAGAQVTQAACGNVVCADEPGVCNAGCVCCVFANGNSRCMPPDLCGRIGGDLVCPEGEVPDPVAGCVPEAPPCMTAADCGDLCAVSCVEGRCSTTPTLAESASTAPAKATACVRRG